jgi:hypothetical protein
MSFILSVKLGGHRFEFSFREEGKTKKQAGEECSLIADTKEPQTHLGI